MDRTSDIIGLYCHQIVTPQTEQRVRDIISELQRLQAKAHAKDARKALLKRRYVTGIKECNKAMKRGAVRGLIVAVDIEKDVDQLVEHTIIHAQQSNVPVIFALSRRKLGSICSIKGKVAMLMLLNVNGQDAEYRELLQMIKEAQEQWNMSGYDTYNNPRVEETRCQLLARYQVRSVELAAQKIAKSTANAVENGTRLNQKLSQRTENT